MLRSVAAVLQLLKSGDEPARAARRRRRTRHAQPGSHRGRRRRPPTHRRRSQHLTGISRTRCSTPCAAESPTAATAFPAPTSRRSSPRPTARCPTGRRRFSTRSPKPCCTAASWRWRASSRTRTWSGLAHEYLPLTFSRRHGDPSRPWNIFAIEVKGEHGERILNYQGNWRDIFQNWEALALSFPGYVESMIFKFVDASTADGYNPYRIMRDGFDWEVLDPHDAWSYIGYWGDHQVVYLLKLLEVSARYHPGALPRLLDAPRLHLRQRSLPHQAVCRAPRRSAQHHRLRRRSRPRDPSARGRDGSGRQSSAGRGRRALPREPGRKAAGSGAGPALQLHPRGRPVDEHAAAGVERRQQRAGRLRRLDGDALLPAPFPVVFPQPLRRRRDARDRGFFGGRRSFSPRGGSAEAILEFARRPDLGPRPQSRPRFSGQRRAATTGRSSTPRGFQKTKRRSRSRSWTLSAMWRSATSTTRFAPTAAATASIMPTT